MYTYSRSSNFHLNHIIPYLKNINGFIAGGAFKDILNNKTPRDIDIFFHNEKDYNQAVKKFKKYLFLYENDNCISFKDPKKGIQIELIKSIFGSPEEIISKFDFSITQFALFFEKNDKGGEYKVVYHSKFFEHLFTKKLVIERDIPQPIATFNRALKYARYGFGLCRESKTILLTEIIERGDIQELNKDLYFGWD